ncbi:hypothetical protein Tco_1119706 [Tanacetum coccineum]
MAEGEVTETLHFVARCSCHGSDPFRPLWDIPSQKIIYSLDWLPNLICVIISFNDGEIRIMSLLRAASDVPITGMPCENMQQSGSHSYCCSSSLIWSIHMLTTGKTVNLVVIKSNMY